MSPKGGEIICFNTDNQTFRRRKSVLEAEVKMAKDLQMKGIPSYTKMEKDERESFIASILVVVFFYYADKDKNKS